MVLHFDGFDHINTYDAVSGRKYDSTTSAVGASVTGRFEGYAVSIGSATNNPGTSSGLTKTIPSTATFIMGFAAKMFSGTSDFPFLWVYSGSTPKLKFYLDDSTKVLVVKNGSDATLANSSFAPPIGQWFYLEIKATSGGDLVMRVDEVEIINEPAVVPAGSFTKFRWGGLTGINSNNWVMDDLYIFDGTGAQNNDFIGDVRVQTRYVDAIGAQHDFLPASGPNTSSNVAAQVNTPYTDYTEAGFFNYSGTVNAIDLYSIGNFTASGTVYAVQSNVVWRKDDVGSRKISQLTRIGSNNFESAEQATAFSDYSWFGKIWENNPDTDDPWSIVELNNAQFGIKIVA